MAGKKKRKAARPWWRKPKVLRRVAMALAAAVVVAAGAWLVLASEGGDGGPKQYLREPAPPFTLPTIAGEQVSLADHAGRHAVLLYFNEGMG